MTSIIRKSSADKTARPKKQTRVCSVVGIGASAGGVEALKLLFEALRPDTGMAYVVVTHLGAGKKSILTELLSHMTSMPVHEVTADLPLEPNHVYVRPPDRELTISGGRVVSREVRPSDHFPPVVIDSLLRSLAIDRRNQAIGIVLSGSGADGQAGLLAIKAEGGLTFVQDQESAKVAEMPRAAASAADFVLSPAAIAEELHRLADHPYLAAPPPSIEPDSAAISPERLAPICALIRQISGPDFSYYKPGTIQRRVARRMALLQISTVEDYTRRLAQDRLELAALNADLLIKVTEFFRDPATFAYLQHDVFPALAAKATRTKPIRAWVPACATGEEAYSIAIALLECLNKRPSAGLIQIFATDASPSAIRQAREGVYPPSVVENVSAELLDRYFTRVEGGFRIARSVRDLCVFAVQDLTADPPFSKMDLVSCRNLLIYFKPEVQQKVLATLHYALNPSGLLLLGSAETTGALPAELFRQVAPAQRIYERMNVAREFGFYFRGSVIGRDKVVPVAISGAAPVESDAVSREADRILVSHYVPPSVVIGPNMEILQFRGSTGLYLELSPGPATLNLPKMCREGLALDLRAAIQKARKSHTIVSRSGLRFRYEGGYRLVDIDVVPIRRAGPGSHELVVFRPSIAPPPAAPRRGSKSASQGDSEMAHLQRELLATQEDLRSTIRELEANNEQLQSANEEILSSNEELQSTNEELETAQEELQATNEEISTVNDEMRIRHNELRVTNDDLMNSLEAVDAGVVIVGSDLVIRRYNPRAEQVLGLVTADLGRLLSSIKTRFEAANPEELIFRTIKTLQPGEREICNSDGRWYLLRTRPYRTLENKLEGAVLTVIDIHDLKTTQQRLEASERAWREMVEQAPDFLVAADASGLILFLNRSVASLAQHALVSGSLFDFLSRADRTKMRLALAQALATGEQAEFSSKGTKGTALSHTRVTPIRSQDRIVALAVRTGAAT